MDRFDGGGRPIVQGDAGYSSCAPLERDVPGADDGRFQSPLDLAQRYVRESINDYVTRVLLEIHDGDVATVKKLETCDCIPLVLSHRDVHVSGVWLLMTVVRHFDIGSNVVATYEFRRTM